MVKTAIEKYRPGVIVLNAAQAQFADDVPILMGTDGVHAAVIIASHLDAVNHAMVSRADMRRFVMEKGIAAQVRIPEDGETVVV